MYRRNRFVIGRKSWGKTFLKQILICIVIVLLIIVAKKMDIAIVNNGLETFRVALTRDYTAGDIAQGAKTVLAKVGKVPGSVTAAFQESEKKLAFSPPTDQAAVVATFGEKTTYFETERSGFARSMKFSAEKPMQVYSVKGGVVSEVNQSSQYGGTYIKVSHGDGIESIYGGCAEVYVKPLEKVKKGQMIGSVAPEEEGGCLNFELWVGGEVVDPASYINF